MRVRALFWTVLGCVCLGILAFAVLRGSVVPLIVKMRLALPTSTAAMTTLFVSVTDTEGVPIDGARIQANAFMTNMRMSTDAVSITALAQGAYEVRLHLSMAGPWAIILSVRARGFVPFHHTLYVQVT